MLSGSARVVVREMAEWLQTSGVELDRVGFWLAKGGWMGGRCLGRYLVRNDGIWVLSGGVGAKAG